MFSYEKLMLSYTEDTLINEAYNVGLTYDDIKEYYRPQTPQVCNPGFNYNSNALDIYQLGRSIAIHRIKYKIYSNLDDLIKIKFMLGFVIKEGEEIDMDYSPLSLDTDRAKELIQFLENYLLEDNKIFFGGLFKKCIKKD